MCPSATSSCRTRCSSVLLARHPSRSVGWPRWSSANWFRGRPESSLQRDNDSAADRQHSNGPPSPNTQAPAFATHRRRPHPPRSNGLRSPSHRPQIGRRLRRLVCQSQCARPSGSSVRPALKLRERCGHERLALHGIHEIDWPRAAKSGDRIIEPAGHPFDGVETFGSARTPGRPPPAAPPAWRSR